MVLKDIVEISKSVSLTARKREKISLLASLLRRAEGEEIALAVRYLSGQIPQSRLGIGWATVQEALKDLSDEHRPLGLIDVNRWFDRISRERGPGSSGRKVVLLRGLLSHGRQDEREFLIGLLMGEIRQGALEGVVLEALSRASSVPIDQLRESLMFSGDIGEVGQVALEEGSAGLSRFQPRLFHPISPMLANSAEGEEDALERLGEAGFEYKIDGARIQIHKEREQVRIFTRHLKDITERLPELVVLVRTFQLRDAIIEGEAFASRENHRPLPFQTTMRRLGRIQDIERLRAEIPLVSYFFDLLYLDGESFIKAPYRQRLDTLSRLIPSSYIIPRKVAASEKEAQDFLRRSLDAGHEGIMAKDLDSPYVAGHRGNYWLKIKPVHTLDLVVLAAEWGHGRRRGWLSNLHLGARDPESGRFIMLGKTFKGLTDEMLRWQTKKLLELESSHDEWTVQVKPELVVEVAFSDFQESPRYPGGLALRFARVRRYREDKTPNEADTIQKAWQIFEARQK